MSAGVLARTHNCAVPQHLTLLEFAYVALLADALTCTH
jgi:hypothetical protein